ncbi:hypothetical protein [Kitasatospora sp. LaBMicrA B282]|uniref:hypothetical protein n=1 Tax=Kitasatospora sp. LaBMicrA B282 TaxID=3420949 RepID=UPI003D0A5D9B
MTPAGEPDDRTEPERTEEDRTKPDRTEPRAPGPPAGADRRVRGNLEVLRDWAGRATHGGTRRVAVRFWARPVALLGTDLVRSGWSGPAPRPGRGSCAAPVS